MGIGTTIGLVIIVLHLVAGFGYMIYMLSPRKEDGDNDIEQAQE